MTKHTLPRLMVLGAALALGMSASSVDAQQRREGNDRRSGRPERFDPAQRIERRVSFLTEQLQLSASQQTQVRSILTEELNAMQALRPPRDSGRDSARARGDVRRGERRPELDARRDSVRTQMQQIRQRTEQRLANVLNAAQRTKYQELQKQMDERRKGEGPGAGAQRRGRATR